MLKSITIKNFKSIQDLTLDLSYSEKIAPKGYKESNILSFLQPNNDKKNRITPVMNIYGANASGKSNIIEAILYSIIIIQNMDRGFNFNIAYFPNKLKNLGTDISVKLEFFVNKDLFEYEISYNRSSITKEFLKKNGGDIFNVNISKNEANFNIETKTSKKEDIIKFYEERCLNPIKNEQINSAFAIMKAFPGITLDIAKVYEYLTKSVIVFKDNLIESNQGLQFLAQSINEEPIQKKLKEILLLLKIIDVDIVDIGLKRETLDLNNFRTNNQNEYRLPLIRPGLNLAINKLDNKAILSEIKTYHMNANNEKIEFEILEESLGTQLLLGLLPVILRILEIGGVFIIDELDKSLHPLILNRLIKMFKDKNINSKGAQIICTLHTTDILEESIYKKSEFAFVNKNPIRGSFITRLSDFEEIRNDMNFRDRYMQGRYFGIPTIYS